MQFDDLNDLEMPGRSKKTSLLDSIRSRSDAVFADLPEEAGLLDKIPAEPRRSPVRRSPPPKNEWESFLEDTSTELDLDQVEVISGLRAEAIRLYRAGKFREALTKFEDAIRLLPGDMDLLYHEAMCLHQLRESARALEILEKLEHINRGQSLHGLPKLKSLILLQMARFRDAEDYLRRLLVNNRQDVQILNMLAFALERQNKSDDAREIVTLILSQDPANANANNTMAWILCKEGKDLNRALRLVRLALGRERNNPKYLDTFAMILFRKGDTRSARRAWNKALSIDPENRDIRTNLSLLQSAI